MSEKISDNIIQTLKNDSEQIVSFFQQKGYPFPEIPTNLECSNQEGEAYARAYPIQGILKYHGFYGNPDDRIAYFPSISLNNTCAYTLTYVKLSGQYKQDQVVINGEKLEGRNFTRVEKALTQIRKYTGLKNKALIVSRNLLTSTNEIVKGKGLGTSASGSAALAAALISIIYQNDTKYVENQQLISFFSRFLSGSGCRSASGGISLWLSHPQIDPFDCFSFRLDQKKHESFINSISLLTIPIESDLKTVSAHKIAPKSLFFENWLQHRKSQIFDLFNGLETRNFKKIGELAEFDTHCLHSVTMTGGIDKNIIAWHPKTIEIMHSIRKMRKQGTPAYYSIDTGPSVIILFPKTQKKAVKKRLNSILKPSNILEGKIGGKAKVLKPDSPKIDILKGDINKFK